MHASYLQTFAFSEQGCRRHPARTPRDAVEVGGVKRSKQPKSPFLCASSAVGRWGWAMSFQASSFWLRAMCRRSNF